MTDATRGNVDASRSRLDKWLWAARFYKTRSLAAAAVDSGQVKLNGERVKASHVVRVGDSVEVRKQGLLWESLVTAVSDRRGDAAAAALLYSETAASAKAREEAVALHKAAAVATPRFPGRPTKRQRRKLADFLGEP